MATENHKERAHALLSASGASRWMNCTPSARLEERFEDEGSSIFAAEGTLAHEFGDVELTRHIKQIPPRKYKSRLEELRADSLYTDEMEEFVKVYVDYVKREFTAAKRKTKDAILSVEEKVDLTEFIEDGFGTNDAMIISDDVLEVIDLKYGKGVRVDADDNSQLKLYGLGALSKYELSYDIKKVRLTIVQPRLFHISTWDISAEDLLDWGASHVKTKAAEAYAGEGKQCAGDWCKWCKAKPVCKVLADKNLELIQEDFDEFEIMKDSSLVEIHSRSKQIVDWLKAVSAHMLKEAKQGHRFEGLKLVEGRSVRRWTSEDDVATKLAAEGYGSASFTNVKVKGIGDIEKLVGKKEFPVIMDGLVIKPQGAPTLAPESDKRREFNSAAEDFEN